MSRKKISSFGFKTLLKSSAEYDVNGNVICYPDIIETTNYELLNLLKFNRSVNSAHVQKMGVSVTQLGHVRLQQKHHTPISFWNCSITSSS